MIPKVYNKRDPNVPRDAIYVGRPSIFGNPFIIGKHGTRSEVIEKYRLYLLSKKHLLEQLTILTGKDLVCWCAPQPCHADILLKLANEHIFK